jgi:uncharacterized protein
MLTLDGKPVFYDEAPITRKRMTREGYLVADVRAARSGIYHYRGSEVGMPDKDIVRVYRSPETVFDKRTMRSFTSLDVTNEHPPELVNSTNWDRYAVGHTGEDVARDGEYIRVPIMVRDQAVIDDVNQGKVGLSFGYTCDVEPTPGVTPQGEQYDAVQKNLTGNHLAICHMGRAGSECRIEDSTPKKESRQMPDTNIRTVLVDGIPVQATDASATVIDTLQGRIKKANEHNLKLVSDHANEVKVLSEKISAADKALAERDVKIKALEDAVTKANDAGSIDQLVADRVDVLTKAKALGLKDEEVKGKTNEDVIKLAVAKKLGDSVVAGKSIDYVRCAFDLYSNDPVPARDHDPLAEAVRRSGGIASGAVTDESAAIEAHNKMVADMESAWKNPPARVN